MKWNIMKLKIVDFHEEKKKPVTDWEKTFRIQRNHICLYKDII